MYTDLHSFLELASLDGVRVEVSAKNGDVFTGLPIWLDEGDDDHLGWIFDDVDGVSYGGIFLRDIFSVRRLDNQRAFTQTVAASTPPIVERRIVA
ncbi:MAG: hypothetical protein LBE35_00550 [Clostridiales bacterium]|jgi:hypothetical protein|nr:hypothetical protein [Clostridiales bacterium]